ncbi:hypothetical protein MVEN_01807900 [Mycena venus]|uniref:DUF6534 domain-containing protein n=1 Tax=Mycena venus TaxID=2733690 RepID=A0A8H6XKX5_9AGAR|nr:hypothetical protein MVEN_01807900 [Mycena venus]
MATAPAGLDLNLQSTYGALLIGCFLSVAVWGVSVVQTILYFMMYDKDPRKLKLLVLMLTVVDTANEILVLKSVWPGLISHWGRVDILGKSEGTIELIHHVWVAAIVAVAVQSFYTWRIYTLSRRKRLVPCVLHGKLLDLDPTPAYNFLAFGHNTVSAGKQTQQLTAIAISLRAAGAAADIIITAAMIHLLCRPRSQFTNTEKMVFRLLILSINSGAWTAVLAILDLISIVAFPTKFTFIIFELPICSLYLSSLLVNLNVRKFISDIPQTTIDLSDMSGDIVTPRNFGEPIRFVQQLDYPVQESRDFSQSDPGSSTARKITSQSAEDVDLETLGAVAI